MVGLEGIDIDRSRLDGGDALHRCQCRRECREIRHAELDGVFADVGIVDNRAFADRRVDDERNFPVDDTVWCGKGVVHFRAGDIEGAISAFDRAVRLNSDAADYWMNLGLAYAAVEDYKKALSAFERGIEITPCDADFWARKGRLLMVMEQEERAAHCFKNAEMFSS